MPIGLDNAIAPPVPVPAPHAVGLPMQEPSKPAPERERIQVTISYKSRAITVDAGPDCIVADLIPDIARKLGALDPTIVHGGYTLVTEDGRTLSPAQNLPSQQVTDHGVLTLHPGVLEDDEIVYDDVVEAVGDSIASVYRPWTNEQTTITSLIISTGMLLIGAGLLACLPSSILTASLALGCSIVLIALGAALNTQRLKAQSLTISLVSTVFASIGGFQMVMALHPQPFYAGPALSGACLGLILIGVAQSFLCAATRPYALIPISIGVIVLIPSTLSMLMPSASTAIWIGTTAFIAVIVNLLPWMCLSFSRISVHSPQSEAEIFELPEAVDINDIRSRYISGSTLMFVARIAAAMLLLLATPLLASLPSPFAGCLCMAAYLGMLIGSRQIYTMQEMIVTVGASGLGFVITCLAFASTHMQFAPVLTIILICCALLAVIVTYLIHTRSLFATRLADAAEIICLVAILPLAYLAIIA